MSPLELKQESRVSVEEKSHALKKKLLGTLTMLQIVNLWSILPQYEQHGIIKIALEDVEIGIAFFMELTHAKRKIMIDQLSEDDIKNMFKVMQMEQKA